MGYRDDPGIPTLPGVPGSPVFGGSGYNADQAADAGTSGPAITDIFNLPSEIAGLPIPTRDVRVPSNMPQNLPPGVSPSIFAAANDMPYKPESHTAFTRTIEEMLQEFAALAYSSNADYLGIQQQLYAGGFFGSGMKFGEVRWGSWDTATKDALVKALVETAQIAKSGVPIDFPTFLAERAKKGSDAAKAGSAQVNQFTDPAAVSQSAQAAAEQAIGRRLTADEAERFSTYFHSKEGAYNTTLNAVQSGAAQGQVDVMRPDLSAEAQTYVEDHYGSEQGAYQGAKYVQMLQSMLGGVAR